MGLIRMSLRVIMLKKLRKAMVTFFMFAAYNSAYADIKIESNIGSVLIFSQKKQGEYIEDNSWSKLIFSRGNETFDIGLPDRYYTEDGSSKTSPSGIYLKLNSISGDYVNFGSEKKYVDKAYCSVIDMRDGCIVSDWDGEACGYDWVHGKDILAESDGSQTFDFISSRPAINKLIKPIVDLNVYEIINILRCDLPDNKNIDAYQKLIKTNTHTTRDVALAMVKYLNTLQESRVITSKTILYSSPRDDAKTKSYLIAGDRVKVIESTNHNKWVHIGYINDKGVPLVAWIKNA